ncbi:MAG: SCP2 sterol-binding domain-containing protein [Alphaproteobacteria bacterium]|nr:SCP2 sterol-binding domain-containing protein [Alphaproteobacteria bacterium]
MRGASQAIPVLPWAMAAPLQVLPLAPVSAALTALARALATAHPGLFGRLGAHGTKRFLIDPTDLPIVLLLDLSAACPSVTAWRAAPPADCRIAGALAALLGLVHGAFDGDALFFSRDLTIEGDTAAALALRNAIDDAELDLVAEAAALAGPLAPPLARLADIAELATGVALRRRDVCA